MRIAIVLTMILSLTFLSASSCDDEDSVAKGSAGGACYSNNTCDEGLSCVNDECAPSTSGSSDDGDTEEEGITLEETIEETASLICDRLIVCVGEENVEDDCESTVEKEFTNNGCKNFDEEQAEPCLNCIEDDLDCTEVDNILWGDDLGTYCGVCNLMCD